VHWLGHWALVRPAAESHGHLASRGADGGKPRWGTRRAGPSGRISV